MGVLESDLPQEFIDESVTNVETRVIKIIPEYATLSDDDKKLLENAIIALAASDLCDVLRVRLPVREESFSGKFEIQVNWSERKKELSDEGESYLSLVLESLGDMPFSGHLILGGPQR